MDVVASHQAGVRNVVATAGTALTEGQLKALSRLAPDVRLAFDQDRAGLAAAERAIPIASRVDVNLSIITIPSGKDPDDLIKQDPELWKQAITKSQYAFDWLMDRYKAGLDPDSAQGKKEFTNVLLAVVRGLTDSVEQDHYLTKIASVGGVNLEALRAKLHKTTPDTPARKLKSTEKHNTPVDTRLQHEQRRTISHLLSLTLMQQVTREYLEMIHQDMIDDAQQKTVFSFLRKNPEFRGDLATAEELQPISDYVKILSLLFEELYSTVDTLELQYEAARLGARVVENFVKQQKTILAGELQNASETDSQELLARVRELDKLLKMSKTISARQTNG